MTTSTTPTTRTLPPCSTSGCPTTTTPTHLVRVNTDRPAAYLPLRGGGFAVMDAIDADRLTAAGIDLSEAHIAELRDAAPAVCLPSKAPHRYPLVVLARIILGAGPDQRVEYKGSDRTDLRRDSIRLRARGPRRLPRVVQGVR